ncbi:MAG: DMT family transporter [Anaerolineaceae bacterium]|nr:DMT family transporter [Anaerolineaceae bacterium]
MSLKSNQQKQLNRGFIVALSSAIVLSFTAILIRMISQNYQLPALILAYWREIFVALSLLPALLIIKPALLRLEKRHLPFMVLFGLVLALFNMLWTLSVTLIGASIATVLVYCSGAFTAILGWWLLKESLGWQKIIAVILCLIGAGFVSGATQPSAWEANALGIVTGILSGLMYAFYSLIGRSATQRGINPWTALFYTFLFASFFMLAANLIPGNLIPGTASTPAEMFLLGDRWTGWLLLLLLAAGPTLLGFGLYNVSLSMLPSSTTNLIVTVEPVFTAITAFFLLEERLTALEMLGSGLILVALVILRLRKRPQNMPNPNP